MSLNTSGQPQAQRWRRGERHVAAQSSCQYEDSEGDKVVQIEVNNDQGSRRWGRSTRGLDDSFTKNIITCETEPVLLEGHLPQAQQRTLALRAAQDAQDSAKRAGMSAIIEKEKDSDVRTTVLGGEAYYLPEWFCRDDDRSLYQQLVQEFRGRIAAFRGKSLGLAGTQEILDECPTYKTILMQMAQKFDVQACYSIVNLYRNCSEGIGSHTDSMNFGANMTIGASFGDPRELVFEHKQTQQRFEFPQRNGDVFAFTDVANRAFRHHVPKTKDKVGPRLSVILWARKGGYAPVTLQTRVMPTQEEIEEAGGDWNRAQLLAEERIEFKS